MPKTAEDLLQYLDELGIEARTFEHAPLHTVEESRSLRGEIPGVHSKNLFVRDRKRRYFLIVLEEDTEVDLKSIHTRIGAQGKVSFGSPEALEEFWGVRPGSVTPFGAINDPDRHVTVVLEDRLAREAAVNFHPLENTKTTTISGQDLLRFLRSTDHEPLLLGFERA